MAIKLAKLRIIAYGVSIVLGMVAIGGLLFSVAQIPEKLKIVETKSQEFESRLRNLEQTIVRTETLLEQMQRQLSRIEAKL